MSCQAADAAWITLFHSATWQIPRLKTSIMGDRASNLAPNLQSKIVDMRGVTRAESAAPVDA